jgi:asparagine synthase (glutamine-hydrolysing)
MWRSKPTTRFESLFKESFRHVLRSAAATYAEERQVPRMTFILFKQVPWHHYARRSLEAGMLLPVSPFLDNELARLAYQCPDELVTKADPLISLISRGDAGLMRIPTDRALHLSRFGWLGKVVRHCREFTAKAEYAYDYGMPPALVRVDRHLRGLKLERLFLGRHKFYHFRSWYREPLAGQISALSQSLPPLGDPFVPQIERSVIAAHTSGRDNHTLAISTSCSPPRSLPDAFWLNREPPHPDPLFDPVVVVHPPGQQKTLRHHALAVDSDDLDRDHHDQATHLLAGDWR